MTGERPTESTPGNYPEIPDGCGAVLLFGSRFGISCAKVERVIRELDPSLTIVVGTTPDKFGKYYGVDWDVLEIALKLRRSVIVIPARWATYGLAAGPIRNGWMARAADRGIGMRRFGKSKGSDDMASKLGALGKPVEVR